MGKLHTASFQAGRSMLHSSTGMHAHLCLCDSLHDMFYFAITKQAALQSHMKAVTQQTTVCCLQQAVTSHRCLVQNCCFTHTFCTYQPGLSRASSDSSVPVRSNIGKLYVQTSANSPQISATAQSDLIVTTYSHISDIHCMLHPQARFTSSCSTTIPLGSLQSLF